VASAILRFELQVLQILGHMPSLACCVECGRPVELAGRVPFGQIAGGVLCPACRPGKTQVVSVSAAVLKTMERFADSESGAARTPIDRPIAGELRGLMNGYIAHLLGHRPKMHAYLRILAD
jgi:DNA repair protein RecO (recombination protein O)